MPLCALNKRGTIFLSLEGERGLEFGTYEIMKNRTLSFGEGLFETFRVYSGRKICFVEEHLERMATGCRFFDVPFSLQEAKKALFSSLNTVPEDKDVRLRLNLITYGSDTVEKVDFSTEWQPLPDMSGWQKEGVNIGLAPFRRFSGSPLVRFKTTSYLENITAFRQARMRGFFDAIFTNEREEITEGSISNIFFINENDIVTPPVEAGLLPGITRKKIIELARSSGISLKEARITLAELDQFESAFVTNSVVEILPVMAIEHIQYRPSDIVSVLQQEYKKLIERL
jgi:branched-subunit amino acid aminotransferase/4-amino-4-deoxychorismate lyase